jgi:hypothetical protein
MAREEEQHACILHACKAVIENYEDEKLRSFIDRGENPRAEGVVIVLSRPQRGV